MLPRTELLFRLHPSSSSCFRKWVTLLFAVAVAPLARGADATSSPVIVHRDIAYIHDGDPAQKLDLSLVSGPGVYPLIIFIHGGGWIGGKKTVSPWAPELNREGFSVAGIGYRLAPQSRFPAQIQDCQAAVRFLRAHAAEYHLDPNRFAAFGDSAGGHLSAMVGLTGGRHIFPAIGNDTNVSDSVQAVCDWYGPSDLLTFGPQSGPDEKIKADDPSSALAKFLGGRPADLPDLAKQASPVTYVTPAAPPFLIQHETNDPLVPVGQSQELNERLAKAGVDVTYLEHAGHEHGHDIFIDPQAIGAMHAFFRRVLMPTAPTAPR